MACGIESLADEKCSRLGDARTHHIIYTWEVSRGTLSRAAGSGQCNQQQRLSDVGGGLDDTDPCSSGYDRLGSAAQPLAAFTARVRSSSLTLSSAACWSHKASKDPHLTTRNLRNTCDTDHMLSRLAIQGDVLSSLTCPTMSALDSCSLTILGGTNFRATS